MLDALVRKLQHGADLSVRDIRALEHSVTKTKTFEARKDLIQEGDEPEGVHVVPDIWDERLCLREAELAAWSASRKSGIELKGLRVDQEPTARSSAKRPRSDLRAGAVSKDSDPALGVPELGGRPRFEFARPRRQRCRRYGSRIPRSDRPVRRLRAYRAGIPTS